MFHFIINQNSRIMKKSLLYLIVSVLVLATAVLWLVNTGKPLKFIEFVQYGVILVLVAFGAYSGISRLRSARRREPEEDEMSKSILRSASSASYYISIYMWLVFMYISDRSAWESHTLIGAGILGMAILFSACWVYYRIRGIKSA